MELSIDGMGCEACQLAVSGAMEGASGVLAATADFEAGTSALLVHPQWGFSLEALAAAVEDAGFEVDVGSAVYEGAAA